jgi:hypothetical protein
MIYADKAIGTGVMPTKETGGGSLTGGGDGCRLSARLSQTGGGAKRHES